VFRLLLVDAKRPGVPEGPVVAVSVTVIAAVLKVPTATEVGARPTAVEVGRVVTVWETAEEAGLGLKFESPS
jgi:hypothetical protein